jgi:hypothetical protein
MKTTYCCPYCEFDTHSGVELIEHLAKFHDFPHNPPKIKRYVLIRIEYP